MQETLEVISSEEGEVHIGLHYIRHDLNQHANPFYGMLMYNMVQIHEKQYAYYVTKDHYQPFTMQFSKTYLQRWRGLPLLAEFLSKSGRPVGSKIANSDRILTPSMLMIIHDILRYANNGPLRKIYIEAKVLELLCISLEQWNDPQPSEDSILPNADVQRIQVVHNHIHQNLSHPGSVSDLARLAGINEHKLKKGFRQLYGTSILAFIIDLRMQQAKSLLLESNHSIKAIANMMGYRDRSNFTAAFRKKFGHAPNLLKR